MSEIKYEIKEKLGILSESKRGWTKEINLVAWNNYDPKYDIREWAPEGGKMGKGVTFTADEVKELRDILNKLDI